MSMAQNVLVIIPTYNEKENISPLIKAVLEQCPNINILVVDDNSPDGTANVVREMGLDNVNLLLREKKQGLGKAYIAGFKWGLENGYDLLVEMDADFSHRPVDLVKIIEAGNDVDVVIGSRWVDGGGTVNWGILRKIISRGGSFYSRFILGEGVRDFTGGFNAWRRSVLQGIGLDSIMSDGYSFQIELKFKAIKNGHTWREVPILFEDRRVGQSKMSFKIVLEALYKVWGIRYS